MVQAGSRVAAEVDTDVKVAAPSSTGTFMTQDDNATRIPSRFSLEMSAGPCAGQTFAPMSFFCSIGRTRASKLHIKDASVSEKHAEVCWNGANWTLRDNGSSNGTVLNGRRLQPMGRIHEWKGFH